MSKIFYVYQLRAENEDLPFYIGKTYVGSDRFTKHLYENKITAKFHKIQQSRASNINIIEEILFTSESEREAFDKEKELIAAYGRKDNGTGILCNHTDGGEGSSGRPVSDRTREAVSKSNRTRGVSLETLRRRSITVSKQWIPVVVFDKDKNLLAVHPNMKEAKLKYGVGRDVIMTSSQRKRPSRKGSKAEGLYFYVPPSSLWANRPKSVSNLHYVLSLLGVNA